MNPRPKLALIGLGRLGNFHARNLAERVARAELATVCDLDSARAKAVGDECGVGWTAAPEDTLGDPSITGVVIAAPTSAHADLVERAAGAGKHVFCEKPLALTLDDTQRAIDAARAAGVLLQIGFHRRFDPDFRLAKTKIAAGELGQPYLLRLSHRDMQAPEPGSYLANDGNLFVDAMLHDFDSARWLVGEVEEVTVNATAVADPRFANDGDVDHAVAVLRFQNGALGVIDNSRAAGYGYECSAEVIGSDATIRIDQERWGGLRWLTPGLAHDRYAPDHTHRHPFAYIEELDQFARAISQGLPSPVPGEDAYAALEISLAATRSHQEGRAAHVKTPSPATIE